MRRTEGADIDESESRAAAAHEVFGAPSLDPAEEARLLARLPVHEGGTRTFASPLMMPTCIWS